MVTQKVSYERRRSVLIHHDNLMDLLWIGSLRAYKQLDDLVTPVGRLRIQRDMKAYIHNFGVNDAKGWEYCVHRVSKYFSGNRQYAEEYLALEMTRSHAEGIIQLICAQANPEFSSVQTQGLAKEEQKVIGKLKQLVEGHGRVPAYMANIIVDSFVSGVRQDLGILKPYPPLAGRG